MKKYADQPNVALLGFMGTGKSRVGRLVAERLGMRLEARFVENEWFKGEWQSELVYAILAREWEQGGSEVRE